MRFVVTKFQLGMYARTLASSTVACGLWYYMGSQIFQLVATEEEESSLVPLLQVEASLWVQIMSSGSYSFY